jgi:hypothetical protein
MDALDAFNEHLLRPEGDPLLDTSLRYLGFINDVGEAGKAFLPRPLNNATYVATGSYAVGAVWNARRRQTKADPTVDLQRLTVDQSIFHLLATFAVTPICVHYTKHAAESALLKTALKGPILPAIIGLASIPVLVPPIDNATHLLLNKAYRTQEEQQPYVWHGMYGFLEKEHAHGEIK